MSDSYCQKFPTSPFVLLKADECCDAAEKTLISKMQQDSGLVSSYCVVILCHLLQYQNKPLARRLYCCHPCGHAPKHSVVGLMKTAPSL